MQPIHRTLLEINEEFLVAETPTQPFLEALLSKDVLNDLDFQQLSSLEPQGTRAVKRFVLHVLPQRGPLAYPSLLEALQEAQAQHLVDLLLEGEAVLSAAVKPIELPEIPAPPKRREDPNEYARKLTANRDLIEDVVNPEHVIQPLLQDGVMTSLEEGLLESVQGQHVLTWTILWGVLLQRGLRAYDAFMAALMQNGYSALFHTIEETKVTGVEAMKSALNRNMTAATALKLSEGDNNNPTRGTDALAEPPLFSRGVDAAPPLLPLPGAAGSGQRAAVSPGHRHPVLPSDTPRPHASPLLPGYSQGDLDLLCTPRTKMQVKGSDAEDPPETSRSADWLYNPTWADPYNHLRGADVVTPSASVFRRSSALENGYMRPSSDVTLLPRRASVDVSDLDRHDRPGDNDHRQPATTNTADPRDAPLLPRLNTITERESEAGTGTQVRDRRRAVLSTLNSNPHGPGDRRRKSFEPERSGTRLIPMTRPNTIGVPRLNLDTDPPPTTSLTYRVPN